MEVRRRAVACIKRVSRLCTRQPNRRDQIIEFGNQRKTVVGFPVCRIKAGRCVQLCKLCLQFGTRLFRVIRQQRTERLNDCPSRACHTQAIQYRLTGRLGCHNADQCTCIERRVLEIEFRSFTEYIIEPKGPDLLACQQESLDRLLPIDRCEIVLEFIVGKRCCFDRCSCVSNVEI